MRIFISYRRDDAQYQADRMYGALKRCLADEKATVFIDIDNIPVGVDFVEYIEKQVAVCEVVLVLLGPRWIGALDAQTGRRRIDDPRDFVRIEIATALARGIRVVPVLLDDARMPREEELPGDLKPLIRRNGVEIRRRTFEADVDRMMRRLNLKNVAGGVLPPAAERTAEIKKPQRSEADPDASFRAFGVVKKASGEGPAKALLLSLGLVIDGGGPSGRYPRGTPGPAPGFRYWATHLERRGCIQFGAKSNAGFFPDVVMARLVSAGFRARPNGKEVYKELPASLEIAAPQARAMVAELVQLLRLA